MRHNSAGEYFKRRFGCKVYRLAVAGGVSCPNRDGVCGEGGCIFCAEGSGGFVPSESDINSELERAKRLVEAKCRSGSYIAYFQSYTATYGDPERLESRLLTAARRDDIAAVSVATRPDCLGPDVMGVLAKAAEIKPLIVELGLQTASDETARFINRGYTTDVYTSACGRLHSVGAEVIAHVMLGLPHEGEREMLATIDLVNATADGVKLQLTHVLEGTRLAGLYRSGEYRPLELDEYVTLLAACVRRLDERVVIHRLTGDGDKRLLLAPEWSADKKRVLNRIRSEFERLDVVQGSARAGQSAE